jgi:hypothetical protein
VQHPLSRSSNVTEREHMIIVRLLSFTDNLRNFVCIVQGRHLGIRDAIVINSHSLCYLSLI